MPPRSVGARFRRWWRSVRVVVVDDSMVPALLPGDRLLVDPGAFRKRPPAVGEIVLVRDPDGSGRRLLKRVAAVGVSSRHDEAEVPPGAVFLLGDNSAASRDSRAFGWVPQALVVGLAWHIYLPTGRARSLPSASLM